MLEILSARSDFAKIMNAFFTKAENIRLSAAAITTDAGFVTKLLF
jgi:hypothetical protein